MRIRKSITVPMIALAFICLGASRLLAGEHHETKVRWDIIQISISGSVITVFPGGISTSVAALIPAQGTGDNSTITLTGTGTFEPSERHEVTGGGTWATAKEDGTPIASGNYRVTEFLFWKMAPSNFAATGIVDGFGDPEDVRTGLAVLRVHYSDGEDGIVAISCSFGPPTPAAVFEGTTATKGFIDYSNPTSKTGLDGNTFFHVMHEDD
ncbi:MAG TPA: hypothetical protein VNX69_03235 [Steroidobacteraceae bacterium]|nr:hypothetical protein [Steroidobacteraceae bacterium]